MTYSGPVARRGVAITMLVAVAWLALPAAAADDNAADEITTDESAAESTGRTSHYLRAAYQPGWVVQTNAFVKGENNRGEPIDRFHSTRLEFGWQTGGDADWHHLYNFPSFGVGIYGADYFDDEELGQPTSLYGFFVWPLKRGARWRLNFETAFGLTSNWRAHDPVDNPNNIAMGLGRSVHIDVGLNAEYELARRWSLVGGFTATHFSNGGTQRPNHGLNQVGPLLFVKYLTDEPARLPAVRRRDIPWDDGWDLTFALALGERNLNLELRDQVQREAYLNRSYLIGNLTVMAGRRFTAMSRYCLGLDIGFDESVADLVELDTFNKGYNASADFWDKLELAVDAGYEHVVNRTHFLVHLGYIFLRNDVDGRLPAFYQRLGVKQFVYRDLFAGLNVRFHEIGSADNLEWNVGFVNRL